MSDDISIIGFQRPDGRKGIRNIVLVAYLVECAHHVAGEIARSFPDDQVHLAGFPGCYPNAYAHRVLASVATHPNVGAVVLVSLGCESFDRESLAAAVESSGRSVATIVIQETGGTARSVELGRTIVSDFLRTIAEAPRVPMGPADLVVGTICGGSDATSGITANPACGRAFDLLLDAGGTAIFEETSELIGCEHLMAQRAVTPELGREIVAVVEKAARYHQVLGHGSFAPGNAEGGLTTIEEKSLGAYAKSGRSPISGILKPAVAPPRPGLYLLDVVPDGDVRFGFPNIVDNAEIVELISCGCHLVLFTTGRGSVVGSAISPVIKVCANPETYRRMTDDMDVNAGKILDGAADLDEVGAEIYARILRTAAGEPTASERLGHREFILGYKRFDPLEPACLP
ncbi:UxaA family hydrolase [Thermostilla marina]